MGFEVEMLAPGGGSRRDLAEALANNAGGRVRRVFYPQSEISEVPGMPVFENLTLAFDALTPDGRLIARCTDDLTILADLDRTAPPMPGWYRIVSDDVRFLRLIMARCDPDAPRERVLEPMAALFGTALGIGDGMVRLDDAMGASIAIAASLPSERERPCELITPPLSNRHESILSDLLVTAHALNFTCPAEAAVHIHYDAGPLKDAGVVSRLARLLHRESDTLKAMLGTNPYCRRLGDLPAEFVSVVSNRGFTRLAWPDAQARLADLDLTKYCDFNFLNLVYAMPGKDTFEVRVLPGSMDVAEILLWVRLFRAILVWSLDAPDDLPTPDAFYAALQLGREDRAFLGLY